MIDIVGAITLAALGVGITGALVLAAPLEAHRVRRLLAVAAAWFIAVTALAGAGVFVRLGPAAIGVAVPGPITLALLNAGPGSTLRTLALGVPVSLLVALNATRVLGAFFLFLHADGRLPATFARSAGGGDIAVGLLALPVAWLASRRAPHWRTATLAWNTLALLDLLAAVTLGIGSTPDSAIRFILEDTAPGTMAMLPWFLIPGYLVPLYLLTHVAVFARLAADRSLSPSHALAHVRHH
jgi:hypothetical protein